MSVKKKKFHPKVKAFLEKMNLPLTSESVVYFATTTFRDPDSKEAKAVKLPQP